MTTLFDIPIVSGLDQSKDERAVVPGSFLQLENAIHNKFGAIEKRPGFGKLGSNLLIDKASSGSFSGAYEVHTNGERVYTGYERNGYRIAGYASESDKWVEQGTAPYGTLTKERKISPQGGVLAQQMFVTDDHITYVYSDRDFSDPYFYEDAYYIRCVDKTTGEIVYEYVLDDSVTTYGSFGGCNTSDKVFIGFFDADALASYIAEFVPATRTMTVRDITTFSSIPTARFIDCCTISESEIAIFAEGILVYGATIDTDTWLENDYYESADGVGLRGGCCSYDGTNIYLLIWYTVLGTPDTESMTALAFNPADMTNNWEVLIESGLTENTLSAGSIHGISGGYAYISYLIGNDGVAEPEVRLKHISTNGTGLSSAKVAYHCFPLSGIFDVNSIPYQYFGVITDGLYSDLTELYASAVLVRLNDLSQDFSTTYRQEILGSTWLGEIVGVACQSTLAASDTSQQIVSRDRVLPKVATSGSKIYCPIRTISHPGDPDNEKIFQNTGLDVVTWNTAKTQKKSVVVNNLLCVPGTMMFALDGKRLFELGFVQPPVIQSADQTGASGVAAGTYAYVAVYEWTDDHGNLHQSAPSLPFSVTLGSAKTVTPHVRTTSFTRKKDVTIALYRTKSSVSGPFYRITTRDTSIILNDITSPTVSSFEDSNDDAALEALQLGYLYTTGELLDNDCPPACSSLALSGNRVWSDSGDVTRNAWYSKRIVFGEPPSFSSVFQNTIDPSETLTGVGNLDEKAVLFTANGISVMAGEGPNDFGQPEYGPAFPLATDSGCSSPESIQNTPQALLFLGNSSIYALSRSLETVEIGQPIVDLVSSYPTCLASAIDRKNQRVFWVLSNGTYQRIAVFDYKHGAWSVWKYADGTVAVYGIACVSGSIYLATDDGVLKSSYGSNPSLDYNGGSAYYPVTTIQTPHVKVGPIPGYQRVSRVTAQMNGYSGCTISYSVYNDFSTSASQTETFSLAANEIKFFQSHVKYQKCATFSLKITDANNGSTTENQIGFSLSAITLELEQLPGSVRLASGDRKLW